VHEEPSTRAGTFPIGLIVRYPGVCISPDAKSTTICSCGTSSSSNIQSVETARLLGLQ